MKIELKGKKWNGKLNRNVRRVTVMKGKKRSESNYEVETLITVLTTSKWGVKGKMHWRGGGGRVVGRRGERKGRKRKGRRLNGLEGR